ncbi:putative cytoskeleton-associated protein CAP5.5 [Balamuthia mandrillaris]
MDQGTFVLELGHDEENAEFTDYCFQVLYLMAAQIAFRATDSEKKGYISTHRQRRLLKDLGVCRNSTAVANILRKQSRLAHITEAEFLRLVMLGKFRPNRAAVLFPKDEKRRSEIIEKDNNKSNSGIKGKSKDKEKVSAGAAPSSPTVKGKSKAKDVPRRPPVTSALTTTAASSASSDKGGAPPSSPFGFGTKSIKSPSRANLRQRIAQPSPRGRAAGGSRAAIGAAPLKEDRETYERGMQMFRESRQPFSDREFPATINSIFPAGLRGSEGRDKDVQNIEWKTITQLSRSPALFVDGVDEGDVMQGNLGNCWLLSAMSIIAGFSEQLIKDLFLPTCKPEVGLYQCRFYKNGEWITVTVDDRIPVMKGTNRPYFGSCKDENEFWVPLLEKAYAKLHGSYAAIVAGNIADGLTDLTGDASETIRIVLDNKDALWARLLNNVKEGFLMGCCIDAPTKGAEDKLENGLLANHAYSILDCQEYKGVKLIRLRNPWGHFEWNGDWSDKSDLWNSDFKRHFNLVDENDGTFYMCLEDFADNFDTMIELRIMTDDVGEVWGKSLFRGKWDESSAGGCRNNPTWNVNPQYLLRVQSPNTKVYLSLLQEDWRLALKHGRKIKNEDIGFLVLKKKDDLEFKKISYTPDEYYPLDFTFTNRREVTAEWTAEVGNYIIIPCTFYSGVHRLYALSVYTLGKAEVKEITKELEKSVVAGSWKGISAAGHTNIKTWINNPRFLLTLPEDAKLTITLEVNGEYPTACFFYLLDAENAQTPKAALHSSPCYANGLTSSIEVELKGNKTYAIVACTFETGAEGTFNLIVHSTCAHPPLQPVTPAAM